MRAEGVQSTGCALSDRGQCCSTSWVRSTEGWYQPSAAPAELPARYRECAAATLGAATEDIGGQAQERLHSRSRAQAQATGLVEPLSWSPSLVQIRLGTGIRVPEFRQG